MYAVDCGGIGLRVRGVCMCVCTRACVSLCLSLYVRVCVCCNLSTVIRMSTFIMESSH